MKKLLLSFFFFLFCVNAQAAIAVNLLTSGQDTTDATSYATSSVTPTANALVLIYIYQRQATSPAAPTSVTGNGLTWVKVTDVTSAALASRRISVWRAMGASPSAGAITINLAATQTQCTWAVLEFTGVDTTGTNGSGAIVQSGVTPDPSTGTSGLITLSAFGSTNNYAYGAFHHFANEASTQGSGFTEAYDIANSENAGGNEVEYKANDNTVDASWTTSIDFLGIAIEVKQAVASTRSRLLIGS